MESKDQAVQRRRVQNRMAQRRFRGRQRQKKARDESQNYGYLDLDLYCEELSSVDVDLSTELPDYSAQVADSAHIFEGLDLHSDNPIPFDSLDVTDGTIRIKNHPRPCCMTSSASASSASSASINPLPGSNMITGSIIDNNIFRPGCSKGEGGWLSSLHIAAQKGHDKIVRVLLERNMDCNEKDSDGLTPLMHAAIQGHDRVTILLLSHGACIGQVDSQGRSALHWAILHRREVLLKMMLNSCVGERASIDGYDSAGRTPLHIAVEMGFEAGVQILLQFGANLHHRARKS